MSGNKQGAFMKIENSLQPTQQRDRNNLTRPTKPKELANSLTRLRGVSLCVTGYSSQHPTDTIDSDTKTINIGSLPMNDTAQEEIG